MEDDDMLVIDWIGKTSRKQNGFFMFSPVYGESMVQFLYAFILLGLIAAQSFYALTGKADAEAALDKFGLPMDLVVGIYVLPVFSALSFLEFVMARRLLKSEHLLELLCIHLDSQGRIVSDGSDDLRQSLVSHKLICTETHLHKALQSHGGKWMQKRLDPSQTKHITRVIIVLLNLTLPIVGLVFFFVCNSFGVSSSFFLCAIVPLLVAWLFHLIADTAVFVMAQFCKHRIIVMRSDFDSIIENEKVGEGQFLSIIGEYVAMEELMMTMSGQITNLIYASMAGMLVMFWYSFACALQALAGNIIIFLVMICCGAGLLFLLIFLLYPLAQVTDLAVGKGSLGKSSSLIVSIHKCGMLKMTPEVHGEYLRLLQVMLSCPIGIKVSIIGLLQTSDLVTYAKTLAAALPTMVSFLLKYRPST